MVNNKKLELSELFNYDYKLEKYQCLNPSLELLYNDYLNNKKIELVYHGENLMKYINRQKEALLTLETNEEYFDRVKKREKLKFIKKCIYRGLIPASIVAVLIAIDDFEIHQKSNILNSYAIYQNLSVDSNNDGMDEINTDILNEVNNLNQPTDDTFYKNSNPMYKLIDEPTISDNISFMVAMNKLDKEVVELNREIYSKTGYITEIYYTLNGKEKVYISTKLFKNMDTIRSFLKKELNIDGSKDKIIVYKFERKEVKNLEDIPTINKSQETGKISFEEPSYLYTKTMKKVLKIN